MMKRAKTLFLGFPAVLVLALASQITIPVPDDPLKNVSSLTWDDIRRDNATTVTARVEDNTAIIQYSDGREERIELVKDSQSYAQSNFP
jgi:hypothetical protein